MTRMLIEEFGLDPLQTDANGDNLAHQAVSCPNANRYHDVIHILQWIWHMHPRLLYTADRLDRTPLQICILYLSRHNRLD